MATGKKLTGINPLAYMGVEPTAPPQLVVQPFPPTPADVQNNNLGTIWIVPKTSVWMLTSLAGNTATWQQLAFVVGSVEQIDTDAGNAFPAGGVIDVLGGLNINTAGAGNVVTINLDDSPVVDDFEATGNSVIFSGLGASGVLEIDPGGNLSASKGTDGQVLIGSTAGAPAWANITSNDATVTITDGANTIDLSVPAPTFNNLDLPAPLADGSQGYILSNGVIVFNLLGTGDTFIGNAVGNLTHDVTMAQYNTMVGTNTATGLTTGADNSSLGGFALQDLTTGDSNVALGVGALQHITSGEFNLAVGTNSGDLMVTGTESSNILIGHRGVNGESNAIHIGTAGGGTGQQNACSIAGIFGSTVDAGSGIAVFVDNTGLLGTIVSSRRFKDKIEDLGAESNVIHRLRPVSFVMKNDKEKRRQIGLIAEEVASVIPEMVIQQEGAPYSVKYEMLPVLLLNELQLMYKAMSMQESLIFKLSEKIANLEQHVGTMSKMTMCD